MRIEETTKGPVIKKQENKSINRRRMQAASAITRVAKAINSVVFIFLLCPWIGEQSCLFILLCMLLLLSSHKNVFVPWPLPLLPYLFFMYTTESPSPSFRHCHPPLLPRIFTAPPAYLLPHLPLLVLSPLQLRQHFPLLPLQLRLQFAFPLHA